MNRNFKSVLALVLLLGATAGANFAQAQVNWPAFKNQPTRTGVNGLENTINTGNAKFLTQAWIGIMGDLVDFSSPAIVNGVVYIGSQLLRPGKIKHSSGGRIVFGELDGQVHELTQAVEQALTSAQISCEVSRAIRNIQWRKLLWNAPFCAISCLTRATVKEIVESDSLTKLALDCMMEVREAAKAQAIVLDPGLFDETLNFSKSLGDFKPSMLQDLEAGKRLELDALLVAVVELADLTETPAPTLRGLAAASTLLAVSLGLS